MFKFLTIAFLILIGCPKTNHNPGLQEINITENDSGRKLALSKGRLFILTLPNRVDGGYRFDKAQYDSSVLRLAKHTVNPPSTKSHLGSPGEGVWQFVAIKEGKTALKITASRPWANGGTVTIFENIVTVQ